MIEPITDKSVFIAAFRHFSTYFLLICERNNRLLFFQVIKNAIYKETKMGFSDVLTNGLQEALNVIS